MVACNLVAEVPTILLPARSFKMKLYASVESSPSITIMYLVLNGKGYDFIVVKDATYNDMVNTII